MNKKKLNEEQEELMLFLDKETRNSKELTVSAKLILADLIFLNGTEFGKNNGYIYRSRRDIMKDTGIGSEHTLVKSITLLINKGYINRKNAGKYNGNASEFELSHNRCTTGALSHNRCTTGAHEITQLIEEVKSLKTTVLQMSEDIKFLKNAILSNNPNLNCNCTTDTDIDRSNIYITRSYKEKKIITSTSDRSGSETDRNGNIELESSNETSNSLEGTGSEMSKSELDSLNETSDTLMDIPQSRSEVISDVLMNLPSVFDINSEEVYLPSCAGNPVSMTIQKLRIYSNSDRENMRLFNKVLSSFSLGYSEFKKGNGNITIEHLQRYLDTLHLIVEKGNIQDCRYKDEITPLQSLIDSETHEIQNKAV